MSASFLRRVSKRFFIAVNLGIAIFFLLGCYSSWFNPRHFWFIGLLTLASFYFLMILVIFIFFWLFAKARWSLISIISILLAWQPLKQLIQIRATPNFTLVKHPSHLRVLTWNVEHFDILEHKTHPERKQLMIDMIKQYEPDVVCFQEMVAGEKPNAINYLQYFAQQLGMPYYHYSFNKKLDFDNDHHFGIIIMSKLPLAAKHTMSYEPNDYNSIFQYVDVVKAADTFRVVNLHLQSLKFSSDNLQYIESPSMKQELNMEKSKSILSKLRTGFFKRQVQSNHIKLSLNQSPYPLIVCGDFNDVPNSYAYNKIGDGLQNAFAIKGTGIGRTFYNISPTLRIDNIFVDKRFTVEQYVRIKKKLSDHFPVIADLYFNKPE
ncbi:MAG: endonuclease/exonuclease/phosphatase family protein [Ferruginibacter sp.]